MRGLLAGISCAIALMGCASSIQKAPSVEQLLGELREQRNIQTCDGKQLIRSEIAQQLGERGDPRAIDPLIAILSSPDREVLSSGASGCQPGSKSTYPAAIEALGKFGPQANAATPRLIEMLGDPETSHLTPVILQALQTLEPVDAVSKIGPAFAAVAHSTPYQRAYLKTLLSFEEDLRLQSQMLSPILQTVDIQQLSGAERGHLLAAFLYSGVSAKEETWDVLLSDAEAIQAVPLQAFAKTEIDILPRVLGVLNNFDQAFSEAELKRLKAWCGPRTQEGLKNSLRSKLFSILNALCTPESLAAVEDYKRKHGITDLCESTSGQCLS